MATLLSVIRLSVLYTGALILIVAALRYEQDPAGSGHIDFTYKVF